MIDDIPRKSLKRRLIWQFSGFVVVIMTFITIVVTFMLTRALSRDLKTSLSVNASHILELIEQRISFLVERTRDFSKNHFVINSLIDPQGRALYLPKLVRDFGNTQDVSVITILDFEGNVIHSNLGNPPNYRETIDLRTTLATGETIVQVSDNKRNMILVDPIEYYQTPQGAVIVEFNLVNIVSRALPEQKIIFHKLYSGEDIIFSQNFSEEESYIAVKQQTGKDFPCMNRLEMGIEIGALKAEYLAPVQNAVLQLVLIGISFIVVAVFMAVRMGNSIARPILELCDKVGKAAMFENERCSPVGTGDELEELAHVFDDRTEQLLKEIEERERIEQVLRESEEKYRSIFESIQDVYAEVNFEDGTILEISPSIERVGGYSREEMLGKSIVTFYARSEARQELLLALKESGRLLDYEVDLINKQGQEVPCSFSIKLVTDPVGKPTKIVGTMRDITERKWAMDRILWQNAILGGINKVLSETLRCETDEDIARTCLAVAEELTNSKFGFIGELNPAGLFDTIAISNPGWDACKMPGSEATKLIKNMPIRGIGRSVLRDEKSRIVNEPASHPDRVGTPKGHPPITSFLGVPLKHAGKTIGMIGLTNKESGYELADQQAVEALSLSFVEALNHKRAKEALKSTYAELTETQVLLIQSEKLAALGRFSAGISHEIKNPLGIILGGIGFLEKKLSTADNDIQTALEKIKESTLRANNILHGLLTFARPSELRTEKVMPEDLIESTLSLLKLRAHLNNIVIMTNFPEEKFYIEVDKDQVHQVLLNLFLNAVEAMPNGGEIKTKVYRTNISKYFSGRPACVIQIIDTGEGISDDNLSKVVEPFFTTKRDSKGTGLGLSISKMVVDKHNGHLLIDNKSGEGTEVKLVFEICNGGT